MKETIDNWQTWICTKCYSVFLADQDEAECCGPLALFDPATHGSNLVGLSNSWLAVWKQWREHPRMDAARQAVFKTGNAGAAMIMNEFVQRLLEENERLEYERDHYDVRWYDRDEWARLWKRKAKQQWRLATQEGAALHERIDTLEQGGLEENETLRQLLDEVLTVVGPVRPGCDCPVCDLLRTIAREVRYDDDS